MKKVIFIQCVLFILSGYARSQSLNGTQWLLTKVIDPGTNTEVVKAPGRNAELSFTSDSTYRGSLCNGYSGNYKTEKTGVITMKRPMSTKKYCSGGISEFESKLFSWYQHSTSYTLEGKQLKLYTTDKSVLIFEKQE